MDVIINPSPLWGKIDAPPSKSFAHRLLILSALAEGETFVACPASSEDIEATSACLRALGAKITPSAEGFAVSPITPASLPVSAALDCVESGSTLRFMVPVCCALGVRAAFTGRGRLPSRPMGPLITALSERGCSFESDKGGLPFSCDGKLQPGKVGIAADVSSQFISGLMLALPVAGGGEVELKGKAESVDYIKITAETMKLFGAEAALDIKESGGAAAVGGRYVSPGRAVAEGDWSNSAFWFCAAALGGGEIEVRGLNGGSAQGDKRILELLARFGAEIKESGSAFTVRRVSALRAAGEIDASDIPDLVPALAAVAAAAQGRTVIKNAARLRSKESDRIETISAALSALGANISETSDGLVIKGKPSLEGGEVNSYGDHRIAMAAAAASCACKKEVTIRNAGAAFKSYPGFFKDFAKLGGNIKTGV